jgi:hypothetical protein
MSRWKRVGDMRVKASRLGSIGFVRAHPAPVFVAGTIQKGVLRRKSSTDSEGFSAGMTLQHLDWEDILQSGDFDAPHGAVSMSTDQYVEIASEYVQAEDWIQMGRTAVSDVVINDYTVSKHHARVAHRLSLGGWVLEELSSTNGTTIDGVAAEPNVETRLKSGACVAFGRVELTYLDPLGFFEFLTGV